MRECERVEAIVHIWEEEGLVSALDLELVTKHCGACKRCAERFSALIALMERDARGASEVQGLSVSAELADKIMARVGSTAPGKVLPRLSWPALAAACVAFALGIGVTLFVTRAGLAPNEVTVHFELDAPDANSVALVGNFTGWDPSKLRMKDTNHNGVWQITVHLKKESVAIYNFVIDGSRWIPDPRSSAQLEDGFGSLSSVLRL